jgi:deoxyribodipyrimidine photo-lyase
VQNLLAPPSLAAHPSPRRARNAAIASLRQGAAKGDFCAAMTRQANASPVLLWMRRDLRLRDNAALAAAIATGREVIAAFVLDEAGPEVWAPGGASRWWLHHSLQSLAADLAKCGAGLVLRRGTFETQIPALVAETGACEVHAGLPHEPWARLAVAALGESLGVPLHLHETALLHAPGTIRTQTGGAYGVYTPFSRACHARGLPPAPLPAPTQIRSGTAPRSDVLADWRLLPTAPDWAAGLRAAWQPGEAGAQRRLAAFIAEAVSAYAAQRDRPGIDGTSRLSPHLAFGEISPADIWHAALRSAGEGATKFLNEVLWREFAANLLWEHPTAPEAPLRPEFARMPWREDAAGLRAWQRGLTGIPIVDAGMRQLWQTGWMHNRVRMIAASFLIKHLLLPWQLGEAWFWDTLVDADLATNALSWQWVAGCGADAAPFFRIFNPLLQGLKFDADGAYVRRFVPELAGLPDGDIHAPWEAAPDTLARAGITLGETYPAPIVDLADGRQRALDALKTITKSAA